MDKTRPSPASRPRFGLQRQALVAVLALFGVVIAVTVVGHLFQLRLAADARHAIEVDAPQSVLACRIACQTAQCRRFEKDFELCWDNPGKRDRAVISWQSAYEKLEASLDFFSVLEETNAGRQRLQQWRNQSNEYRSRFLGVVRLVEEGRLEGQAAVSEAMKSCQAIVQGLTVEAEAFAADRMNDVRASGTAFQETLANRGRLLNASAVVATLALALCSMWFFRSVLGRVRVLSGAVLRFAAGDWNVRLACDGHDELDLLARQFNKMATAIQTGHDRLNQATEAAQMANRAKSEFLAGISDEIRGPVTVSLGYTEMLLGNLANPENLETAGTIKRNNQYVLEVIDDLRDLSKIEAGRLRIAPVPCSPQQIVAEVASQTRVRADAKGLSLSVKYEGPVPEQIRTDPARLRQILVNLVGNAIKFTEIGTIRLRTRFLDGRDGQPRLQFKVIDPGTGMTQRQITRLFKPLTPDDSPLGQEFPATGLGLTICKRMLDMLGGTIEVDSTPGCGSTFTVAIPTGPLTGVRMIRQPGEETTDDEQPAEASAPTQVRLDCRILLAEDGRENRRLLSFILKKAGAEVAIAENGQEAVEKALAAQQDSGGQEADSTPPFDLILMDMQMPVMDGYDAARRLRQEGYTGRIIAVTGHSRDYDRQKCLNVGCDDYLAKPVDRQQLLEMVAKYVQGPAEQPSS